MARRRRRRVSKVRRFRADPRTVIEAPKIFALHTPGARQELANFLTGLQGAVVASQHIKISFATTKEMSAEGTILFVAELERIMFAYPKADIRCTFPANGIVAQLLQHIGVLKRLKQRKTCNIEADTVKYWRVASGEDADGEKAADALSAYDALFKNREHSVLYKGLTEAMTNCRHHAYQLPRDDRIGDLKKWWLFSQYRDDRLVFVICDLGIGIPRSLKFNNPELREMAAEWLRTNSIAPGDGPIIQGAVESRRTATDKAHRGRGLMDIRSTIVELKGRLNIYSNRGSYHYDSAIRTERSFSFKKRLKFTGTIVSWSVPVPTA